MRDFGKDFVLAVSGGVDSVVLLDMLSKQNAKLIVAYFDHGTRVDSASDGEFVRSLAEKYGCSFETRREELGADVSEELARKCRYGFLREISCKHDAQLITAHHADDVIETIAINIIRGTGWRGLASMDSDILRPLAMMFKSEIINYARQNNLQWREDSTNASDKYLRNRIRKKLADLDEDSKMQLLALWEQQKFLRREIDFTVDELVVKLRVLPSGLPRKIFSEFFSKDSQKHFPGATLPDVTRSVADGGFGGRLFGAAESVETGRQDPRLYKRQAIIQLKNAEAIEILRAITYGRLTRPQMQKMLIAINTFGSGKVLEAGGGIKVHFTTRNFKVELIK